MRNVSVRSPMVSIIIPAYNSEATLADCIQSAVSQSYDDIEVIVVDDGSTDSTITLVESYVVIDSRIVLVKKEKNGGLVLARKTGIDVARGKYIQYLDADDTLCEGIIECLVRKAEEAHADLVVAPFFFCIDGKCEKSVFQDFNQLTGIEYLKLMLMGKTYWCVWAKFHLRSLYRHEIERPDISLGEDVILSTQLSFYSKKVVCLDKEIVNYNFTPSSMSHPETFNDSKYRDFEGYVDWMNDYVYQKALLPDMEKEVACFNLRTIQMRLHWNKIEDVDDRMKKVITDLRRFPDLRGILTRRERKIIAIYRWSHWLGYLNLKYYKKQGKLLMI